CWRRWRRHGLGRTSRLAHSRRATWTRKRPWPVSPRSPLASDLLVTRYSSESVAEVAGEGVFVLTPGRAPGVVGEAGEAEGGEVDGGGAAVEDLFGEGLSDGGAFLEAGAAEADGEVEAVHVGDRADDRVGVGRHVVEAGVAVEGGGGGHRRHAAGEVGEGER